MVEFAPFEMLQGFLSWAIGLLGIEAIVSASAVMSGVVVLYGIHKAYWLAHLGKTASRYAVVSLIVAAAIVGVLVAVGVFPTVDLDPIAEVVTP
jgi:hypothetical protein